MKKLSDIRLSWPVVSALWGAGIGGLGVHYFGFWGFLAALILAAWSGHSIERQRIADSKLPFSRDVFEDFGKELLKAKAEHDREERHKNIPVRKVLRALKKATHVYFHPNRE
jgi:hypothetical protein